MEPEAPFEFEDFSSAARVSPETLFMEFFVFPAFGETLLVFARFAEAGVFSRSPTEFLADTLFAVLFFVPASIETGLRSLIF